MLPADNVIASLPDYSAFGRKTTLRLNPDKILDLNWNIATQLNAMAEMLFTSTHIEEVISFSFETCIVKRSR